MKICIGLCSSRFDLEFKKSIKGLKKIIIPKNVWYAFKGMSDEKSILFNFLSIEHRNTETINKKF